MLASFTEISSVSKRYLTNGRTRFDTCWTGTSAIYRLNAISANRRSLVSVSLTIFSSIAHTLNSLNNLDSHFLRPTPAPIRPSLSTGSVTVSCPNSLYQSFLVFPDMSPKTPPYTYLMFIPSSIRPRFVSRVHSSLRLLFFIFSFLFPARHSDPTAVPTERSVSIRRQYVNSNNRNNRWTARPGVDEVGRMCNQTPMKRFAVRLYGVFALYGQFVVRNNRQTESVERTHTYKRRSRGPTAAVYARTCICVGNLKRKPVCFRRLRGPFPHTQHEHGLVVFKRAVIRPGLIKYASQSLVKSWISNAVRFEFIIFYTDTRTPFLN